MDLFSDPTCPLIMCLVAGVFSFFVGYFVGHYDASVKLEKEAVERMYATYKNYQFIWFKRDELPIKRKKKPQDI